MPATLGKTVTFPWQKDVSLQKILRHYRGSVSVTWGLLIAEALVMLSFPWAIGLSVDSLIEGSNTGIIVLGLICTVLLVLSAGRRFYDTRVYARIYRQLATALVARKQDADTSKLTAQVTLLEEIVEFLENALPELLGAVIAFVGVIIVLGFIDGWLMLGCLAASALVVVIYVLSGTKIFDYNKHQNDELERRVTVLAENRKRHVEAHFGRFMKWNIKLSDLETLNYAGVWIVLASLLLGSIVLVVGNPAISYGQKITAIMYVFEYIEVVMAFPLFYQQVIRLQEIIGRLSLPATTA